MIGGTLLSTLIEFPGKSYNNLCIEHIFVEHIFDGESFKLETV